MMEQFVAELKKQVPFKDTTSPGDIVLLVSSEPRMVVYALVTSIERDEARKDLWWSVSMQVLSVPLQQVVWTLREPQFTGKELFTFSGIKHFMKAVSFTAGPLTSPDTGKKMTKQKGAPGSRLRIVK